MERLRDKNASGTGPGDGEVAFQGELGVQIATD